jgi:hypothetical protein
MKGVYLDRRDHFETLAKRSFGGALLRPLEQQYKRRSRRTDESSTTSIGISLKKDGISH